MRHLKLVIQYDGTNYNGWQVQRRQTQSRTVQWTMQAALSHLTGQDPAVIRLVSASRTDAGVHARGQVVLWRVDEGACRIPAHRLPYALNGLLPPDLVVKDASEVSPDFHPRYAAVSKTYSYTFHLGRFPDPFWERYAYRPAYRLDYRNMILASTYLLGRHDWRSFCAQGGAAKTFERTLFSVRWRAIAQDLSSIVDLGEYCLSGGPGPEPAVRGAGPLEAGPELPFAGEWLLRWEVRADGFLYHMVRNLAGTLVEVGRGARLPEDMPSLIAAHDRSRAGPTAPARGLCLERVEYHE